jgi:hypothetical protein
MNRVKVTRIRPQSANRARALEHDRRGLPFGPPPLLDGENKADYDDLYARVAAAVQPADFLEEIWVRDTVDLTWEILRLRRLKIALFNADADGDSDDDVSVWLSGNVEIVDRIDLMIARAEARRNAMVREIDRHQAALSNNLRRSVAHIEDGNYHVSEEKLVDRKRLA